ncbi:MAG: hypothetical protein HY048_05825 [Acidobacteria bacterium]|nr:hypothetical protein [Acidobacteriota bacterium]
MAGRTDDEMLDQDLDQPATRRDLHAFAVSLREEMRAGDAALREEMRAGDTALREEMRAGDAALREEMRAGDAALDASLRGEIHARDERIDQRFDEMDRRFDAMDRRFDELRAHFDLTAENFRAEFRNLYDWTLARTSSLGARLDHVEKDHGTRLLSVETRVTRLERRRQSNRR